MYHRHVFTHNQNTAGKQRVLARKDAVWFAPSGQTYMVLPTNRGIINPSNRDITYTVATTPAKNTSSPRLFGKRHVYGTNTTTLWF